MGDPRRGASLGRANRSGYIDKTGEYVALVATDNARPFTLIRVRMNGAYDAGGAYWGLGDPLYYFSNQTGDICGYVRGKTRDISKAEVKALHPAARFYR